MHLSCHILKRMNLGLVRRLKYIVISVKKSTIYHSPFDKISFFPSISLDDVLEMEFEIGMFLHIPIFEEMDFYQFQWKFDRIQKHKKQLNSNGNTNIADGTRFG